MVKEMKSKTGFMLNVNMSTAIPPVNTKVPLVSLVLPRMGAEIPMVAGKIELLSARVPLLSAHIPTTLPRDWGLLPSRHWGRTYLPTARKQRVKRPQDIGLFKVVSKLISAPVQPLSALGSIGKAVERQAGPSLEYDKQQALLKELGEIEE